MNYSVENIAKIIIGLAQYEGYKTSFLQTVKNITSDPTQRVFAQKDDEAIFNDLVRAINYAQTQNRVTADVIKQINAFLDSHVENEPKNPGILRKNVIVSVGEYTPAASVYDSDLDNELKKVDSNSIWDSWEMYARLAKLQPFDDGNKRTALISANINSGALSGKSENYLFIPTDFQRMQFDTYLYNFYVADDWDDHLPDVEYSLAQFTNFATDFTEKSLSESKRVQKNSVEESEDKNIENPKPPQKSKGLSK
ncbi:MAG: Fic family protein [Streptococcaceae bacterium]|jgi:prophage maintenance system killer protein|nr:Fic family protein [Streptococcaceae bacterium]